MNDLVNGIVGGENRLGFGEFFDYSMIIFNNVYGIYYLPDLLRRFKNVVSSDRLLSQDFRIFGYFLSVFTLLSV